MTACSPALTLFPLASKPVVVTADGGALTSDAGVLLVQRVDQQLGLSAALAQCLPDGRDPAKVQHSLLALVRQRLYQICLGYEDANDADTLRLDPALKSCRRQISLWLTGSRPGPVGAGPGFSAYALAAGESGGMACVLADERSPSRKLSPAPPGVAPDASGARCGCHR